MLKIQKLNVWAENKCLIDDFNLVIKKGEIHVLMGPNGSGKSTLAQTVMGNPNYQIKSGLIRLNGRNLISLSPEKRSRLGLFVSFQNPPAISGVSLLSYLQEAVKARIGDENFNFDFFYRKLRQNLRSLKLDEDFLERSLNDSFSGGERKKVEILSFLMLFPKFLILDEVDTGLDIDSLKLLGNILNRQKKISGLLLITHSSRILNYLKTDAVHILLKGRLVKSGRRDILPVLERSGYAAYS